MSRLIGDEAQEALEVEQQDPHKKIAAEKIFDQAIYGGISYAAQAGTGIVLSYWLLHSGGKKYVNQFAEWLGKNFNKGQSAPAVLEKTKDWIVVTTMVMCGNAFLLPVKYLENRKAGIVRWINDKRNESQPPTPEEKQEQENRLYYLEHHAHKQDWWSLGLGRAFGLGAVYTVLPIIGTKRNEAAAAFTSKAIRGGIGKLGFRGLAESEKLKNLLHISFYDGFYSMVSAGGLYAYSHFIHPIKPAPVPADADSPATKEITEATPAEKNFVQQHATPAKMQNWQSAVQQNANDIHTASIS